MEIASEKWSDIDVHFTPSSAIPYSATLVIESNAKDSPHEVPLTGTGTEARLTAAPLTVEFSDQEVGTTSEAAPVRLGNRGKASLKIEGFGLAGDHAGDFTIVDVPRARRAIAPIERDGEHIIRVTFRPRAPGERRARIIITSNARDRWHKVELSGTGKPREPSPPAEANSRGMSRRGRGTSRQ
jgi:hypothetical protein